MPLQFVAQGPMLIPTAGVGVTVNGSVPTKAWEEVVTAADPCDFTVTAPAGANTAMVAYVLTTNAGVPTAVTWDSGGANETLTQITGEVSGSSNFIYVKRGYTPGSSKILRVAGMGSTRVTIMVQCYNGVLQGGADSTAFTDPQHSFSNTSHIVLPIASAAGDMATMGVHVVTGTSFTPFVFDDTQIGQGINFNTIFYGASYKASTSSSQNIGMVLTGGPTFNIYSACNIKQA